MCRRGSTRSKHEPLTANAMCNVASRDFYTLAVCRININLKVSSMRTPTKDASAGTVGMAPPERSRGVLQEGEGQCQGPSSVDSSHISHVVHFTLYGMHQWQDEHANTTLGSFKQMFRPAQQCSYYILHDLTYWVHKCSHSTWRYKKVLILGIRTLQPSLGIHCRDATAMFWGLW